MFKLEDVSLTDWPSLVVAHVQSLGLPFRDEIPFPVAPFLEELLCES